ncbi:hypothetical protein FDN13_09980 [Caloramator sp. E03]|uniref:PD-(D/E)XK nuclease family protein n=1 Tax=Caloramator sp. E03 TaxID=2576307 RepID=UPI0011108413|nr:PD-(D/E)XK nuclease family protein [Caloramator sp. E03]QCX34007.1 hypothetical protein FDN13_09980 [Caloramator sp. E03]
MKEIYFNKLLEESREYLIEECIKILNSGKKVIYIAPSREAIFDVRNRLIKKYGGIMNTFVGGFDDLEWEISKNYIDFSRVIDESAIFIILENICKRYHDSFIFFSKVLNKEGFIQSAYNIIKRLKRFNITVNGFKNILDEINNKEENKILYKKCYDIYTLYNLYQQSLKELDYYDVDDISFIAAESALKYEGFKDVGIFIIDGYIYIDPINIELIKNITDKNNSIRYICNIPFKTKANEDFIKREIINNLTKLQFEIIDTKFNKVLISKGIEEISLNIFNNHNKFIDKIDEIRIINAPCIEDEVRQVSRIVKELVVNNSIQPSNIALVTNSRDEYEGAILDIFNEMGIPVNCGYHINLTMHPFFRELISLLKQKNQELEDINLDNFYFSKEEAENILCRLKSVPNNNSISNYLDVLEEIIKSIDYKTRLKAFYGDRKIDSDVYIRDIKAYVSIISFIKKIKNLYNTLKFQDIIISYDDFLKYIKAAAINETITIKRPDAMGVKILDPDLLRAVRYDFVFILGLNDGIYPKPSAKGGIFTIEEREILKKYGLYINCHSFELEREKIRFVLTCSCAEKGLYLSYRTADEDGSYMIKSSFLEEIEGMLTKEALLNISSDKRYMRDRFNVSLDKIYSNKEAKAAIQILKWQSIIENVQDLFEEFNEELWYNDYSTRVERQRYIDSNLNIFNGTVKVPIKQNHKDYLFSASQINNFVKCPFKYFIENVLGIRISDDEYNPKSIGLIYHRILKAYYESSTDIYTFNEGLLKDCIDKVIDNTSYLNIEKILMDAKKEEIENVLCDFLKKDAEYLNNYKKATNCFLKPIYFEKNFKEYEALKPFNVVANVDRVDVEFDKDKPTGRFIVYDYKKSSVPDIKNILCGEDFQLGIYYYCVLNFLTKEFGISNPECVGLIYYSIEDKKRDGLIVEEYKKAINSRKKDTVSKENFKYILDFIKDQAIIIIEKITKKEFKMPIACPENAYEFKCGYKGICRYENFKDAMMEVSK